MDTWSCQDVTACTCAALNYVHTHFPCRKCQLRAVSRSVEYRHWQDSMLGLSSSAIIADSSSPSAHTGFNDELQARNDEASVTNLDEYDDVIEDATFVNDVIIDDGVLVESQESNMDYCNQDIYWT